MDAMQRYVSKELTHFVGRNPRETIKDWEQSLDVQYKILIKIIQEKCISYPPHSRSPIPEGMKYSPIRAVRFNSGNKFSDNDMFIPSMVCFCDIPIGDLGIHITKFSFFGLSFKKSFLIERGANPVLYVEKNSAISYASGYDEKRMAKNSTKSEYFDELSKIYVEYCNSYIESVSTHDKSKIKSKPDKCIDISDFVLFLLGYVKFFDASKSDDAEENFYMEREWRTPYDVHFEINDIYRIILPSDFSNRFRTDVPEYAGQITFSDENTLAYKLTSSNCNWRIRLRIE